MTIIRQDVVKRIGTFRSLIAIFMFIIMRQNDFL